MDPATTPGRLDGAALVTTRTVAAAPARILAAFTDAARLARWWGPAGFTNTFQVFEPRPGGRWTFTMHGPDGKAYPNDSVIEAVDRERIVVRHVSAPPFVLTISLEDLGGGKTRVGWRQAFASADLAAQVARFALAANEQNLDRLEAALREDR
jgi:uncharacterized protein YndB with AHSA1/START domain